MGTDVALDRTTHDLAITQNGLTLHSDNSRIVAQRLKMTLLMRLGEWFANTGVGVPYLQFSRYKNNKDFADTVLASKIIEVEGVEELVSFSSELQNRNLVVTFTVRTSGGEILDLTLEV